MDFNAQQMREDALLKEGRYRYRVLDAKEKRAMSGNDMLNLKHALVVNGRQVVIYDTLVLIPKMFWKLEHYCKSCGMPDKIEAGRVMAQDCFDTEGWLEVGSRVNSQTGELENVVKDYVKPEDLAVPAPVDTVPFDDDIKI